VNISSPHEKIHHRGSIIKGRGKAKKKHLATGLGALCRGATGLFCSPLPAQELYHLHCQRRALPSWDAPAAAAGTLVSSSCLCHPVTCVEHRAHLTTLREESPHAPSLACRGGTTGSR